MTTKATKTTTTPTDAAERLCIKDLNFIEREVFAFAFDEELASARPREGIYAVADRAMARVTPFVLEQRERRARAKQAGQRG